MKKPLRLKPNRALGLLFAASIFLAMTGIIIPLSLSFGNDRLSDKEWRDGLFAIDCSMVKRNRVVKFDENTLPSGLPLRHTRFYYVDLPKVMRPGQPRIPFRKMDVWSVHTRYGWKFTRTYEVQSCL